MELRTAEICIRAVHDVVGDYACGVHAQALTESLFLQVYPADYPPLREVNCFAVL